MNGLSLDQAPPYKIPLIFYMVATSYLLLFSVILAFYGLHVSDRYLHEAIAITHIVTLGFFMNIIFGTLFQMMPVIIGEAYGDVAFRAKVLLVLLNIGIISFLGYFLFDISALAYWSALFLGSSVITFGLYSLFTIIKTKEKNAVVRSFMTSFLFIIIGALLGVVALLEQEGVVGAYRFGDLHVLVMVFGVVFMLFSAVVFKIIPMFYVTKEYPIWIKNGLHVSVILALFSLAFTMFFEIELLEKLLKTVLGILITIFAFYTIKLLKNRKRARSDLSVNFFYFASFNLALGGLFWILSIFFNLQSDFLLGTLFGMGFIYSLINGMLYKIIPFLTWFHLSSKFVFEAEMGEVMRPKMMKVQFYLFIASYFTLIFALMLKPFVVIFTVLFFISSLLLFYNILSGYLYHAKLIKKAVNDG
jgi:hypothetical protein